MHGFKAHHSDERAQYADGGIINGIRKKLGFTPQDDREKANDPDPAQRVGGDQGATPPVPRKRQPTRSPTNTGPADRRMQEAEEAAGFRGGFKAGGEIGGRAIHPEDDDRNLMDPVPPGAVEMVRGPGTGTSDDVPAEMEKGTHILPAKTTEDVLLSNGESAVSPEVVNQVGQAALNALRSATNGGAPGGQAGAPVGTEQNPIEAAPRGFNAYELDDVAPAPGARPPRARMPQEEPMGFAVGGIVGNEEELAARQRREAAEVARRQAAAYPMPTAAPPAVAPDLSQQMGYGEQMRNIGSALVNAPLNAAKTLVSAPGYGFNAAGAPAAPAPAPAAPVTAPPRTAAPATTTAPPSVAPQPLNADPTVQPSPPQTAAAPPTSNVTRVGNSYSAAGPVVGDITVNGRAPGGTLSVMPGAPRAAAPAENFLPQGFQPQQYQQAPGQGWQARQDLANAMTGASSIVNSPQRQQQAALAESLRQQQLQGTRDAGAANVEGIRGATQQGVANTRAATEAAALANSRTANEGQQRVAEGRLANDTAETASRTASTNLTTQQTQQLAAAQRAVIDAKTPEDRARAVENVRVLQGNYERASRVVVVPGAKNPDGSQDASTIVDGVTGQPIGGAGAATRAAPQPGTVQGGFRFKGGNPADQKNWEKV